jgi:hypothetical protein
MLGGSANATAIDLGDDDRKHVLDGALLELSRLRLAGK